MCGINFSGFYIDVGQGVVHGENENLQAKGKVSEVQIRIMIRIKFRRFRREKVPLKPVLASHCVI